MHGDMGGPHEFRVHLQTNDPAEPVRYLTILSDWVDRMLSEGRIDLLARVPLLKRVLKARAFQPAMMLLTLAVFTLAIPAPGEWPQRRAIVQRRPGKLWSRGLRWPRRLKNMWLQNFGFLGVALFSTIILTRPGVSAWLLLSFLLIGVALSALYKDRMFCRYVCPVGGFIGLYSLMSPVKLRVADPNLCADHKTKNCLTDNEYGYGCPWMVFPGSLTRNIYCGMCFECLKTCPKNNIVLNLHPFGSDLMVAKERRLDEAYKAFIMLGCALTYSAVLLGPWGWLKHWANMDTLTHWALYAAGFLTFNLALLPGLFALVVLLIRRATHSIIDGKAWTNAFPLETRLLAVFCATI